MRESGHYPAGTEFHSNAPRNQVDPEQEQLEEVIKDIECVEAVRLLESFTLNEASNEEKRNKIKDLLFEEAHEGFEHWDSGMNPQLEDIEWEFSPEVGLLNVRVYFYQDKDTDDYEEPEYERDF